MTTENHHGQPKSDDSSIVTSAGLDRRIPFRVTSRKSNMKVHWRPPGPSLTGKPERRPGILTHSDWQAFQKLCYSDTETPGAETIRLVGVAEGVNHLIAAAQRGHAPAWHNGAATQPRVWRRSCTDWSSEWSQWPPESHRTGSLSRIFVFIGSDKLQGGCGRRPAGGLVTPAVSPAAAKNGDPSTAACAWWGITPPAPPRTPRRHPRSPATAS